MTSGKLHMVSKDAWDNLMDRLRYLEGAFREHEDSHWKVRSFFRAVFKPLAVVSVIALGSAAGLALGALLVAAVSR